MNRRARLVGTLGLALGMSLTSADGMARPGGGSGFSKPSSGGGSRSSGSGGSRPSSGGGYHYTPSKPTPVSTPRTVRGSSGSSGGSSGSTATVVVKEVYYCTQGGADRAELRSWQPGGPGPYGSAIMPSIRWVESPGAFAGDATQKMAIGFGALAVPIVLVGGLVLLRRRRRGEGWTTASGAPRDDGPPPPPAGSLRRALASLRTDDPDFSVGLFEDFAYALYAEAHTARGAKSLPRLAPYLGPEARATLESLGCHPVSAIVVGAMRYVELNPAADSGARVELTVEFEACYTETRSPSESQSFYTAERWRFVRSRTARSRPPERARVFACPSCGAPLDRMVGGSCGHCNRVVDGGAFDWTVESVTVQAREPSPPVLTGTAEEAGTNLPTIFDPALPAELAALKARDPALDEKVILARIELIFRTMQTAWTSLEWEAARPYLSDNLFQTNAYWIAAYRAQGLRNVTENARILKLELVRLEADRWFDALTVRIHASGLDYTLRDADGAVVGGDRQKERAYTEYWTLVRGASHRGGAKAEPVCPSCGGPMSVSMAALCTHCGVKVNSGEFDWVLSRIEQDEVYGG